MSRAKGKGRTGRPPLPADALRAVMFSVRLTAAERFAMDRAAKAAGLKASDWARGVLVAASSEAGPS